MELIFARLADRNRPPQEVSFTEPVVRPLCGYTGQMEDSLMVDRDAFQATTSAMPLRTKVS